MKGCQDEAKSDFDPRYTHHVNDEVHTRSLECCLWFIIKPIKRE